MSPLTEINFDGIIGPTHNYAGLSPGNIASAANAGAVSHPRAAALQGVEKMRANLRLGLSQGFFVPLDRPDERWLAVMGTTKDRAEPHLRAQAWSASSMWAANAATVSPSPDSADGRCHLTVANLLTMPHRSHEYQGTWAQLRLAFSSPSFAVHSPIPAPFGDEGAANHLRIAPRHDAAGVEIFIHAPSSARDDRAFPARQHSEASKAIARKHRLDPAKTLFIEQAKSAVAAGAFHNDVVAVANENLLLTHEDAFEDRAGALGEISKKCPGIEIIEVSRECVSMSDAIKSYMFNAQLVTLPDSRAAGSRNSEMALILPTEARGVAPVWRWLEAMVAAKGSIKRLIPVDVRQSMANGGGPACLRLRVVADPGDVDSRFMADEDKLDRIVELVARLWPETIAPVDLESATLAREVKIARMSLLDVLGLSELEGS